MAVVLLEKDSASLGPNSLTCAGGAQGREGEKVPANSSAPLGHGSQQMPCHGGTYIGTWEKTKLSQRRKAKAVGSAHCSRGVSCRHWWLGSDSNVGRGVGKPSGGKREESRLALTGGWGPGEEDLGGHLEMGCPVILIRGAYLAFSGCS